MPWMPDEDGTNHYVLWADLLVADGNRLDEVVDRFMCALSKQHRVVGWECSAGDLAGTELEIELLDESEDAAVRRSLLTLARAVRGVERVELLDRDPLDLPHGF